MRWRGCFCDCVKQGYLWRMGNQIRPFFVSGEKKGEDPNQLQRSVEVSLVFLFFLRHIEWSCWNVWENDSEWTLPIIGLRSALVCRLANHADALSLLRSLLLLSAHSHTYAHKSPLCLWEHRGGSHLTLPERGPYQEIFQTVSQRAGQWPRLIKVEEMHDTWVHTTVCNIMYTERKKDNEVVLQEKMSAQREGGIRKRKTVMQKCP